jgi:hypothetical protein
VRRYTLHLASTFESTGPRGETVMSTVADQGLQASRPTAEHSAWSFLAKHFWKVFSTVVLGLLVWGVYECSPVGGTRSFRVELANHEKPSYVEYLKTKLGSDKQVKPAVVTFKDGGQEIEGYFEASDDRFVLLAASFKADGRIETTLIPWSNILHIRLTTEKELAANK